MTSLNTKAHKVEFIKGLQAGKYSIKDFGKDNFIVFKNHEDEYEVMNCGTKRTEIMNSSSLQEWEMINTGIHQVIFYIL